MSQSQRTLSSMARLIKPFFLLTYVACSKTCHTACLETQEKAVGVLDSPVTYLALMVIVYPSQMYVLAIHCRHKQEVGSVSFACGSCQ